MIPSFLCARAFFLKINMCVLSFVQYIPIGIMVLYVYWVCVCCVSVTKENYKLKHFTSSMRLVLNELHQYRIPHIEIHNTRNEGNGFSPFFIFAIFRCWEGWIFYIRVPYMRTHLNLWNFLFCVRRFIF